MDKDDSMRIGRRPFLNSLARSGAAALLGSWTAPSAATGADGVAKPVLRDQMLSLRTRRARFDIDATGALKAITANGRNCIAAGQPSPLLSVRVAGTWHAANHAAWDAAGNTLALGFDGIGATVAVAVRAKPSHVTLELAGLHAADRVELALWGPYPVAIGDLSGRWSAWCAMPSLPWASRRSTPRRWEAIRPRRATSNRTGPWPTTPAAIPACRTG